MPVTTQSSRGTYTPPGTVVRPPDTTGVVTKDSTGKVTGIKYVDADGKVVETYQYDPANTGQLTRTANEGEPDPTQKFDPLLFLQEYGVFVAVGIALLFKLKR